MCSKPDFRVIIVGGGIAGLTLAIALERADIEYVLLEQRKEFAPEIGASIAMQPNGFRILDQLGLYDEVSKYSQGALLVNERNASTGKLIAPPNDSIHLGGEIRSGYDLSFLDRSKMLEILVANIKYKNRILFGKKVASVEHGDLSVKVRCDDGSEFDGTLLAGADGVKSKVKDEMWKLAISTKSTQVEQDRKALFADYICLFGICKKHPSMPTGDFDWMYGHGRSGLVFSGPENKAYTFIFEKLPQRVKAGNIPYYSQQDAREYAKKHADMVVRPGLTFGDLWKTVKNYRLVAIEEGTFSLWTWGRIACLGDSVHKMTPNLGMGGNNAIESAAALANALKRLLDETNSSPHQISVEKALESYQRKRKGRARAMIKIAGEFTRLQAYEGWGRWFAINYIVPSIEDGDMLANGMSNIFVSSEKVDYLPSPKRSLAGTMPFNPEIREFSNKQMMKRAAWAFPLLAIAYLSYCARSPQSSPAPISPAPIKQIINAEASTYAGELISAFRAFYERTVLQTVTTPMDVYCLQAEFNKAEQRRILTFVVDYCVMQAIWLLESIRRANAGTTARFPVVFIFVAQFLGVGTVTPVYYFLTYITTPMSKFKAQDLRMMQRNIGYTFLPSIVGTYLVPSARILFWSGASCGQSLLLYLQFFPLWISVTSTTLSKMVTDSSRSDRISNVKGDLPIVQRTIGILSTIAAGLWVWGWLQIPSYSKSMSLPTEFCSDSSWITVLSEYFKNDHLTMLTSSFLWLGYLFWDLRYSGMTSINSLTATMAIGAGIVTFGPGATFGLGWLWRETILATKHQKGSIVG